MDKNMEDKSIYLVAFCCIGLLSGLSYERSSKYQIPEWRRSYAQHKLPCISLLRGPLVAVLSFLPTQQAERSTATTTLTCRPECTSDPYCSTRHSWVNNNRHGLEVSGRSRWVGLSAVAPRGTTRWIRNLTSSVTINGTESVLVEPNAEVAQNNFRSLNLWRKLHRACQYPHDIARCESTNSL